MAESYWLTLQPRVAIAKRMGALPLHRALDKAAAQHFVAAIKDACLPRRHGWAAMVEANLGALARQHPQFRRQRRMAVANLHFERDLSAFEPRGIDHPHLPRDQARRIELVARA